MDIRIKNAGLIREAAVKLEDLTLVMGPNNSGKSTVATIHYGPTNQMIERHYCPAIGHGKKMREKPPSP